MVVARKRSVIAASLDSAPAIRRRVATPKKSSPEDYAHDGFESYRRMMMDRVTSLLHEHGGKVFHTDARGLYDIYLKNLPPQAKKYCNCNTCRRFFNDYADLVVINERGQTIPLLWAGNHLGLSSTYKQADDALFSKVKRANVIGVKYFDKTVHGTASSPGGWTHFAFQVPMNCLMISKLKETHEIEAEKNQEFTIVDRALNDWPLGVLQTAVALLESDDLYRADKVLGPMTWLRDLSGDVNGTRFQRIRSNLIWRAIAHAPTGFCHPRSAVTSSLLDDIQVGKPFHVYSKAFAAKMHPLQYRRPQAPPKQQNVLQATRAFEKLGLDRALARRFATVDEVPMFWAPSVQPPSKKVLNEIASGPFARVTSRFKPTSHPPGYGVSKTMTWVKFENTLLSSAKTIQLMAESGPYYGLTTAVYPDAPPLFQWDSEDERNAFGWYTYVHGSTPQSWGLRPRSYVEVLGITERPCHWTTDVENYSRAAIFILKDAKDSRSVSSAIFPEMLRSELHPYRATIEAHSRGDSLHRVPDPACGWAIQACRGDQPTRLRVTTFADVIYEVTIDRWD